MYLEWAPISYYCHETPFENSHTRQTCRKIAALDYFCRLEHEIILGSGRERARAKKSSSLYSVCLGSLNWNETGFDLLVSEDELAGLPTISLYNSMSALSSIMT